MGVSGGEGVSLCVPLPPYPAAAAAARGGRRKKKEEDEGGRRKEGRKELRNITIQKSVKKVWVVVKYDLIWRNN